MELVLLAVVVLGVIAAFIVYRKNDELVDLPTPEPEPPAPEPEPAAEEPKKQRKPRIKKGTPAQPPAQP